MLLEYSDRDPKDPEGDNWDFDARRSDDYSHINGTEGNLASAGGQEPDSEDLNSDGILNRVNDYFHYVVDLARDPHVSDSMSPAGWRLFQLSLYDEPMMRVGSPSPLQIQYARLLLVGTGPETPLTAEIARISIAEAEIIPDQ